MDPITSNPINPVVSTTTPVFGDNVQDLLNAGQVNVKPTGIIVVNSINDSLGQPGATSLRDAIAKGNTDSGKDLIVFDRSLFSTAQTITLSLGELDITHNLDIIAPRDSLTGGDLLTVSGNGSRVFQIESGATVTLSGLIIANGNGDGNNTFFRGGGIYNSGILTLDSSIVRNNMTSVKLSPVAPSTGFGAGIYNTGTLNVRNSTISGNRAAQDGGGIDSFGPITIQNSTISGNFAGNGGGISGSSITIQNSTISGNFASGTGGTFPQPGSGGGISGSRITIQNSIISGNSATQNGGGISGSSITIQNSTISGNSARQNGGGISGSSTTIQNSTISGNSATQNGGGIYNFDLTTIQNSTISGNSATQNGGGIDNFGTSTVQNSTISGNSATQNGGGIYNDYTGTLTLLFNTVTQNQAANGGGVYQNDVPRFLSDVRGSNNVRNTIIASNLNSTNGVNPDVSGTFTSNGYNLIGDSTGSTGFGVTGDIVGTSANPIDPLLAPLAFNGGPTQTIALLPNSPAINAGDPTVLPTDPKTDQRGKGNPRVRRGRTDIGAFESSLTK